MREQVAWAGLIATAGAFSNCASGQRGSGRVDPPALLHLLHLDHGLLFSGLISSAPAAFSALPQPSHLPAPALSPLLHFPPLLQTPPDLGHLGHSLLLILAFGFLWFGHLRTCENQAGSLILYTYTNAHFSTETNYGNKLTIPDIT